MKIGLRTIKTGIAVFISMYIAEIFQLNSPFFVCIASVLTMQVTVSESFAIGRNRMIGTLIGAGIAILCIVMNLSSSILNALWIILTIFICVQLNLKKSITIACLVFLSIVLQSVEGDGVLYGLSRILDTFVGIMVGVLVNFFVFPPNIQKRIILYEKSLMKETFGVLDALFLKARVIDLQGLREKLEVLNREYAIFKGEINLFFHKKNRKLQIQQNILIFSKLIQQLEILTSFNKQIEWNAANIRLYKSLKFHDLMKDGYTFEKESELQNNSITLTKSDFLNYAEPMLHSKDLKESLNDEQQPDEWEVFCEQKKREVYNYHLYQLLLSVKSQYEYNDQMITS